MVTDILVVELYAVDSKNYMDFMKNFENCMILSKIFNRI